MSKVYGNENSRYRVEVFTFSNEESDYYYYDDLEKAKEFYRKLVTKLGYYCAAFVYDKQERREFKERELL